MLPTRTVFQPRAYAACQSECASRKAGKGRRTGAKMVVDRPTPRTASKADDSSSSDAACSSSSVSRPSLKLAARSWMYEALRSESPTNRIAGMASDPTTAGVTPAAPQSPTKRPDVNNAQTRRRSLCSRSQFLLAVLQCRPRQWWCDWLSGVCHQNLAAMPGREIGKG
jgi:hypothetical protein